MFHKGPAAAVGSNGHTSADDFTKRDQISPYPEIFLGPAGSQPESGNDLVKDQKRIVFVAQGPESLQKTGCRSYHAHVRRHRLHNHTSHLSVVFLQQNLHRGEVIILRRMVCFTISSGTPAELGCPPARAEEPAFTSRQSLCPW